MLEGKRWRKWVMAGAEGRLKGLGKGLVGEATPGRHGRYLRKACRKHSAEYSSVLH